MLARTARRIPLERAATNDIYDRVIAHCKRQSAENARPWLARWRRFVRFPSQSLWPSTLSGAGPLDLRIVGQVVFHSAVVGVAAGLVGVAFFVALELTQRLLLEDLVGYVPLRAQGESFALSSHATTFRPWLLVLMPALGGLGCGLLVRLAREARGGGGDQTIEAFHHRGGMIRRRVIWVKTLASLFSLGTGGSGGREGPTMLIGGALGSLVARVLRVPSRERRILLVAGVAAGMSAVFRTPLGAALLAVEFLYKDGFEADALVPSVLASVVSYSVVISILGQTTLFGHVSRFPLVLAHLPLYALLALLASAVGAVFVKALRVSRRLFTGVKAPNWTRPALGGLALGIFATPVILLVGQHVGIEGRGLGLLGGGYGAVQMAVSGATWLPEGWLGAELLLVLTFAKLFASALTIGSEGSAGDFAPSLALGGLLGGAFGRAAMLLLHDGRIQPGAFALVGMGALYGGIAHVPLSALILVCELAGNYDLLVPLMLALGISFIATRKVSLYDSQVATLSDSPVHRDAMLMEVLRGVHVRDVLPQPRPYETFSPATSTRDMLAVLVANEWQDVFPVVGEDGNVLGLVTGASLRALAVDNGEMGWLLAADLMQPPVSVTLSHDLRAASALLLSNTLRAVPVIDTNGRFMTMLDEMDIAQWQVAASASSQMTPMPASRPNWDIPRRT
jgi:chloride channel protein, CIC family